MNKLLAGVACSLAILISLDAQAATTIVNLNASANNPNAGNSSPGYNYNPVTVALTAGTYAVKVVGIAGGGLYDAYTLNTPIGTGSYTNSQWSMSLNNGTTAAYTQANIGRYDSAAAALAAYSPTTYTFSLAAAQNVAFYVDDSAYPYFGDDTGGISLAVSSVPEPASIALLSVAAVGAVGFVRRRRTAALA